MIRLLAALSPALFFATALPQQPPAAPPAPMPADAATLVNPVTPTAQSQAHAKTSYGFDCAMCHDANGNGKGDLVADMQLTLKDLTDPASLANMKDGEIFYIIKNGKGKMPPEAGRAKDNDIWSLVTYVRSLAKK
jgi:mono/diheme cytochrome c family protein